MYFCVLEVMISAVISQRSLDVTVYRETELGATMASSVLVYVLRTSVFSLSAGLTDQQLNGMVLSFELDSRLLPGGPD